MVPVSMPHTTVIDANTLLNNLTNPDWVIVDCRFSLLDTDRGRHAYNAAHLPGAHYADLNKDLAGPVILGKSGRHPLPNRADLEQTFRAWGIHNDTQLVAYDDLTGAIAARLWWLASWLGLASCAVLDGGFNLWQQAGHPTSDARPMLTNGTFTALKSATQPINKAEISAADQLLIDAREAVRFSGEHEPIDPIAGHIPGANNCPFQFNVDDEGRWLAPSALAERFQPLIKLAENRTLVHYCGSGVTAAHNMLAMQHAGFDPGVLYPGSFSDWIAGQPGAVETGE